jgi:DNA-binding NtrC family response regulator
VAHVLLIDDDPDFCDLLKGELEGHGYRIDWRESAGHEDSGTLAAEAAGFDVLLLDNRLPGKPGVEWLAELRRQGLQIPVILITGHGTADLAIEAAKLGVFEFFTKPVELAGPPLANLRDILARAAETSRLIKEPVLLPGDAATPGTLLVGDCGRAPMSQVYALIGKAARAAARDRPVLITGETGTGKDLVARALFHHSDRRERPFLKVKCAAFHEKELETELFGFESNGRQQPGVFEKAHGGAVLLDDIGETGRSVQAKILQVIHEGLVIRGGRGTKVPVDVWVIGCALSDFDSPLYYRLAPPISLPPLRERGRDLDLLADHFLARTASAEDKLWVQSFHEQAREKLRRHPWPGNVRELEQAIRTAVLLSRGSQITAAELKLGPGSAVEGEVGNYLRRAIQAAIQSGRAKLYPFLKEALVRELAHLGWTHAGGRRNEALELTGLPPADFQSALRDLLGIEPAEHGDTKPLPGRQPPPSREKAWALYHLAIELNPALAGCSDAEVFRWLQNDPRVEGDGLPDNVETFCRYLRKVRAHRNAQKNSLRHDRPHGGSIVRPDEI